MREFRVINADVLDGLRSLPDGYARCCVTSPPYWGLRDYGHEEQLGLEPTPEEYVTRMVEVFREVRRVLADDGTLWLNLGDSYAGSTSGNTKAGLAALSESIDGSKRNPEQWATVRGDMHGFERPDATKAGLKPKDLCGIPWRVAFALQADGWWLRSDIIWCLSGGTKVYARTQKGEMPMSIKDMVRLDPSTVQLWNGEKWTQVLGWNESQRGEPLEIELRSGERIGCTEGHLWPTQRGNVRADELRVGDVIDSTTLPEPEDVYAPENIGSDVAWMMGLYLAEGSQSCGRLQFAGHPDEAAWRAERLSEVAEKFGGTVRVHGGGASVVVDCPPLTSIVDQYIHGRTAKTKGIKVRAWRHNNAWLAALLNGYLHGDGHHDADNGRWRIGFTRNDRLAGDLRTICARLGYTLTLKATTTTGFGETWPIYRGEIRRERSGHPNERPRSEVIAIRKSRARKFWDIGVADEPHTFALASGVLTHNSKPNPMPESVTDRPTKAHEYIFLLAKADRYYFDQDAVREDGVIPPGTVAAVRGEKTRALSIGRSPSGNEKIGESWTYTGSRNIRTVWDIPTQPFPEAHFAVYPPALIEPCIKAGSAEGDVVLDPFTGSGTTGVVACRLNRNFVGVELNEEYAEMARRRIYQDAPLLNTEAA